MKAFATCVILAGALTAPTVMKADPSFGFGLTFIFGGDVAAGVRVFSDDEPDSAVLALGADYKFGSGTFRPTVGAAYLDDDFYLDLSLGYDLGAGALDYGIGIGAALNTDSASGASSGSGSGSPLN